MGIIDAVCFELPASLGVKMSSMLSGAMAMQFFLYQFHLNGILSEYL